EVQPKSNFRNPDLHASGARAQHGQRIRALLGRPGNAGAQREPARHDSAACSEGRNSVARDHTAARCQIVDHTSFTSAPEAPPRHVAENSTAGAAGLIFTAETTRLFHLSAGRSGAHQIARLFHLGSVSGRDQPRATFKLPRRGAFTRSGGKAETLLSITWTGLMASPQESHNSSAPLALAHSPPPSLISTLFVTTTINL